MRYKKYQYLTKNFQISKIQSSNNNLISIHSLDIQAGHFKPASTFVEHGLLLTNISSQTPVVSIHKHGKRLRTTVLLKTILQSSRKWHVLDKFINTFISSISDIKQLKFKKNKTVTYSWRIRSFFEWEEADSLLSERILKKDVFLPMFFNINLDSEISNKFNQDFLRMFRVPVSVVK